MNKMLTLLIVLLTAATAVWAQGFETFENFDYTETIYIDGSFEGDNGITWNYYHVTGSTAGANVNEIDGNGMILRRSAVPSRVVSGPIANGIGNFSVEMRKAYTSAGDRQVALYINDNWVADSQVFGSPSGGDPTVHTFEVLGVNVPGEFTMEIRNIQGGDMNRQVTIDNITWTAYGSGTPFVSTPTFDPPAGYYSDPINVSISTTTDGASIYYTTDGSNPDESSSMYTGPIAITTNTTLKARAYAPEYEPSAIATAAYGFATAVTNMAMLRQMPADNTTVYTITNPVILTFQQSYRGQKYFQDSSAAILVDDTAGVITTGYEIGDAVTGLSGKLNMYFETMQFIPTSDPGAPVSSGNSIPTPEVTVSQLNGDLGIGMYQSRLVRVNGVSFDSPSGNYATNPAQNYILTDATGSMIFRTAFYDVDYIDTPMHQGQFNLRGLITHYQTDAQITPRGLLDFNPPVSNDEDVITPAGNQLLANYPNPFNPETTIRYNLDGASDVRIDIYNTRGQLVRSLVNTSKEAGLHSIVWNGMDDNGNSVSSGIYYYKMNAGKYSSTRKMILMK